MLYHSLRSPADGQVIGLVTGWDFHERNSEKVRTPVWIADVTVQPDSTESVEGKQSCNVCFMQQKVKISVGKTPNHCKERNLFYNAG